jgi:thiamine kinase-like enzyme
MNHCLSILRSDDKNTAPSFPMNYLKACRRSLLRHRLRSPTPTVRHSHTSCGNTTSTTLPLPGTSPTSLSSSSSPSSLWGPQGYAHARNEAKETMNNTSDYTIESPSSSSSSSSASSFFVRTVDNRPYFPLLKVHDPTNKESILKIAHVVVAHRMNVNDISSSSCCSTTTTTTQYYGKGTVVPITGGLTNALYKVDFLPSSSSSPQQQQQQQQSYLVRIFGAEGMIDRDEETTNFARLCHHPYPTQEDEKGSYSTTSIVHDQLDIVGRFANGRVETWIPNMRPANHVTDFGKVGFVKEMARQFARLHYGYTTATTPSTPTATATTNATDTQHAHADTTTTILPQPTLWNVMNSWIDDLARKLSHDNFQNNAKMELLFIQAILPSQQQRPSPLSVDAETIPPDSQSVASYLSEQVTWLQERVMTDFPNAAVVFCHNDVNAANVLLHTSIDDNRGNDSNESVDNESAYNKQSVCIIDYEYGSMNYAMYDIANFICEHCGGNDNGCPNYKLLPNSERQSLFLREYIREREKILGGKRNKNNCSDDVHVVANATSSDYEVEVADLLAQVELFQMASNLLWGVWGVLQASGEVMDGTFRMDKGGTSCSDLTTWDNLRYGKNRLERYRYCKEGLLRSG